MPRLFHGKHLESILLVWFWTTYYSEWHGRTKSGREEYLVPIYQAFERPTPVFLSLFRLRLMLVLRVVQNDSVRQKSQPCMGWFRSGSDDPYTIANIGDLKIKLQKRYWTWLEMQLIKPLLKRTCKPSHIIGCRGKSTHYAILAANKLFELSGTRSTYSTLTVTGAMPVPIPCMTLEISHCR